MDQYIGKLLDNRYEILERVGTGGMATVYKAKCHRLNRLVAVKILKSDLAESPDFRRRFQDESHAVAMLSHPNIVSVYDVSRGDPEYIVMEMIDGITLKQYMERRGQLNWREALHFITQIMKGLSHAHSRGIVHRDIKPQNIMVLRDGSVKVTDFGIACLSDAGQTLTQEALGSGHYISPEQAKGNRADARSDIYSSGIVLYEMLTNRLPFEGDSAVSVAIQHLSSVPLAPRDINKEVPSALELICMKAMANDIESRYPTAEAMLADLEEFRKNPDVSLPFTLEDIKPEEVDEPTMYFKREDLAASEPHGASHTPHTSRGEYIEAEYEEYEPRGGGWKKALIAVLLILAAAGVVFGLWRIIDASFDTSDVVTTFEVPSVIGMTVEEARAHKDVKDVFEIEEVGFKSSSEYPAGQIVEQDPIGGKMKKSDFVIRVYVSAGVNSGVMIDVTGEEYRTGRIMIENLDLALTVEEETRVHSDYFEAGEIISTTPAAGEVVMEGQTVSILISLGPEVKPVTVPTFVGLPWETVQAQLDTLKLKYGAVTEEYDSEYAAGIVIEQSIEGTTTVDEGTSIDFVISLGSLDDVVIPSPGDETPETPADSGTADGTGEAVEP